MHRCLDTDSTMRPAASAMATLHREDARNASESILCVPSVLSGGEF